VKVLPTAPTASPMKQGVDGGHDELVDIVASLLHG
jgi:hypothetical protein